MSYFSESLERIRKAEGFSQQDLATRLGCSRSAVAMYETGKREPDIDTLNKLADILNVDMNALTFPGAGDGYPLNPMSKEERELNEILDACRSREDIRMLCKVAKSSSEDDVRKAAMILQIIRKG